MIGRRAAVGLSLLCALMFCAFAAQGASASGTTAFTCKPELEVLPGFTDAHCDTAAVKASETKFVHEPITVETEIEATNAGTANKTTEATVPVFTSTRAGTTIVISCAKSKFTGTLKNTTEGEPAKMHAGGSGKVHYTECKVTKPVKAEKERCTVKSVGAEVGTVTTRTLNWKTKAISTSPEEMGIEFSAAEAGIFVELVFGNAPGQTCPIPETPAIPVEGSVIGTPGNSPNGKGATLGFNLEAGMQSLTFGGAAATYTGTETTKMMQPDEKGNAIVMTTTTP